MKITRPHPKQKMSADAKKVFDGIIFDVYQWQQQLYDGNTATFEMLKRADTVNIIAVTPEKRIVLTKQTQPAKDPFVGMLGGRVDQGELPWDAAKRELLEESGMVSDDWELLVSQQIATKIDWAIFTFIARDCRIEKDQELDGGEKIELMFVEWDQFVEEVTKRGFLDQELSMEFLRAKLDPGLMAKYKKQILGE